MKADRKRLKGEKTDLASQMQQLYATLESREEQLRDFIRNYEQHRKVGAGPPSPPHQLPLPQPSSRPPPAPLSSPSLSLNSYPLPLLPPLPHPKHQVPPHLPPVLTHQHAHLPLPAGDLLCHQEVWLLSPPNTHSLPMSPAHLRRPPMCLGLAMEMKWA